VFQGFGHLDCWMGADSSQEIYPRVIAHARQYAGPQENANRFGWALGICE
jgi:hypothetical protein